MKTVLQLTLGLLFTGVSSLASAQAVLLEEGGQKTSSSAAVSSSIYQSSENLLTGAIELRKMRKMGVGAAIGGATGQNGVNFEFNYEPTDSMIAGIGGGPGYEALSIQWKHTFPGHIFTPYFAAGLARWGSAADHGSRRDSSPSMLSDQFLSEGERESGRFGKTFLTPTAGLQFYQLTDEFAGASFYTEVLFLYDIGEGKMAGTGGLGAVFYF